MSVIVSISASISTLPSVWQSLWAFASRSVSDSVLNCDQASSFFYVLPSVSASCSQKLSCNLSIRISFFKCYNVSRSVLAFASCTALAIVSTTALHFTWPGVPRFVSTFVGGKMSRSVSTSGWAFTSLIVSLSVVAFSSGGVLASVLFNALPFTTSSFFHVSCPPPVLEREPVCRTLPQSLLHVVSGQRVTAFFSSTM